MKCCELFIQVFNAPPWNDKWTNETTEKYLREIIDNKRFMGYTLWENDVLTGVVFCHIKSHYKGDEIFVDELFVSPDYQRKGYGMELMGAVEKYAKENSFVNITLLTSMGSPSFKFYEKFGCRHLDYLAFMYKHIL